MTRSPSFSSVQRLAVVLLALGGLASSGGCSIIGAVAAKGPAAKVRPNYTGLKGKTVGVMAWTDVGLRNEHPSLQLDVSEGVTQRLRSAQGGRSPAEELAGTTFPPEKGPAALLAFQRNNPLYDSSSITEAATKLGLDRLIYITVDDFTLNPEEVPELHRGDLSATVQVVEVEGGKGRIAITEKVRVNFPPGPGLGRPDLDPATTYRGTMAVFTEEVLRVFITHVEGE